MHVECGHAVFGKHSKFSTMRCRKCNFMLIDVEVRILLTFQRLRYVCIKSVYLFLGVYTRTVSCFSSIHFQGLHLGLWIQKSPI